MIFATLRLLMIFIFRFLGKVTFFCSKKRRPIAQKNIDLCFKIKNNFDAKRNEKISQKSFIFLGHALADFLLLRFYNNKNIDKYISVKNINYLHEAMSLNKGVIITTAHFGSWELAAHYLALKNYQSLVLYNPIKKYGWLENFIKKNRELSGNTLISKHNALLPVYRQLINKKIVTFIIDQHCHPNDGIKVPLFGHNVWTHTAFIKLSLKTGAPILSGFTFIKDLFKYELEIFKPLYPQDYKKFEDPEHSMACASNSSLEKAILKDAGSWMWQHRRFKNL
ncbi:lysophospholipid acyltransferase family protein [Candidatus Babeliales bacterium]|nr:lysophospholipid acyltransferase family protein [Candidatus Babeliales bacterium]MCF7899314.1 lysophospholipid acyltransferase family protein [Candidatus Babeliales bacterium]